MPSLRALNHEVERLLEAIPLTQTEIANHLGVSQGQVSHYKNGRATIPPEKLEALRQLAGEPPDDGNEEEQRDVETKLASPPSGKLLGEKLEDLNVTRLRFAKKARLMPATITNVINGKKPQRQTLQKIERTLSRLERHAKGIAEPGRAEDACARGECIFQVKGPFEYPASKRPGGWWLEGKEKISFWNDVRKIEPKLPDMKGVYVFAIGTPAGYRPLYVGKTRSSFSNECFNQSNWKKYHDGLSHHEEGTPIMFLIHLPRQRGIPNERAIGEVEMFLTQLASIKNRQLVNIHYYPRKWSIQGLNEHLRTDESEATHSLRNCLGLAH